MQLTRYTDYSLRVLLYLAVHPEGGTVPEIAQVYGVSQHHLVKVVHNLGKLGMVLTTRGKGGGVKLNQPAEDIRIGEAVRRLEPHFNLAECFNSDANTCPITGGKLGNGFPPSADLHPTPTPVLTGPSEPIAGATDILATSSKSCALRSVGTAPEELWCWGTVAQPYLESETGAPVGSITTADVHDDNTCVVVDDGVNILGELWCSGADSYGRPFGASRQAVALEYPGDRIETEKDRQGCIS